jgi:2-C-methyl-D-erythritol 4-phosphate cytidylyltransferase
LPVHILRGEETNLKVTTPVDLAIAEFILRQRQDQK